ncbi:MAG TPA: FtsX-like permease family protein [Pyrinomonadaceae bacterium]|jgi:ABC-type antimicrobial peptide transport system permease subunit|nr:FtsX-like permease family protein [Pyrinomonadaceae bacterium]
MHTTQLIKRSLAYYWQTNLVVVLGVAIAVSVLAGALLIGESVRGSLRDLSSRRLGKTDDLISSPNFFREQLATDLEQPGQSVANGVGVTCPMIALEGVVVHESSKRRAGGVKVYGVDERFWKFNGVAGVTAPENRNVFVSQSLASELGSSPGESLLLRIEKPSDIPVESLHGKKEDPGKTIRLSVAGTLGGENLGEFSLQPQHGAVRAVFVSLRFLQQEIEQAGRINTILVARLSGAQPEQEQKSIAALLKTKTKLDDLGLKLRTVNDQKTISLESESKIINEHVTTAANEAAKALSLRTVPVLSYLANSISARVRSTPYSLVTALDDETLASLAPARSQTTSHPPIILNDWIARDLNVKAGDTVSLEYYLWHENGRLETKKADFQLAAIVPITGVAADRELVPEYPGITESEDMAEWDPPFPIDLDRVRKEDEDYWHQYRATPKAFIPLSTAQNLWQTRFGKLTSIRVESPGNLLTTETVNNYSENLRKALDPALIGFQVVPVRDQGQAASRGATDFGEYFLYFSFFLVVAALMLTTLFFKLGIEQRAREIGTLQAIGLSDAAIRRLFLVEGTLLAGIGSLLGLVGAIVYAALLMYGLRTWWVDAVGTTALTLHISWSSLVIGVVGGVAAAVVCIFLTLRRLGRSSTRSLLMGSIEDVSRKDAKLQSKVFFAAFAPLRETFLGIVFTTIGVVLLIAGTVQLIPRTAAFFGGGVILLIAGVLYLSTWLKRSKKPVIQGSGWWTIARLGFRNATYRPGRTVLCITLIASAAFIIVAVDAFRRSGVSAADRKSGTGGFPLLAESLLPVVHDANTREGRESLNLSNNDAALKDIHFVNFRVRPGDDTSCLNLYQPRNPKIVAPPESFINDNRFTFQNSVANTADEQNNPWLLLNRELENGVVPVIGDANSLTYVLHLKVGDELVVDHANGPLRLRVVAALSDSIFQSELLMSEKNFLRQFPSEEGYRMFLLDTPGTEQAAAVSTILEERLSDFGFDVVATNERLANFHRVENTYLSTFQMLGGLGLALGTLGMAAVLLRNVFERRRELALLRAVGYNSSHFAAMVITENVLMLCCGLAVGFVCALLAIAPVFVERGGRLPNISLGLLLLAVLVSGATASLVATLAALRSPLLPALRAE